MCFSFYNIEGCPHKTSYHSLKVNHLNRAQKLSHPLCDEKSELESRSLVIRRIDFFY